MRRDKRGRFARPTLRSRLATRASEANLGWLAIALAGALHAAGFYALASI